MKRVPIRIRVTLAFAGVMAAVLTAVGLFLYLRLEAQLDESIDSGLRSRAGEVAALARGSAGELSGSSAEPLIERDESFAEVLDLNGGVVDASSQLAGTAVLSEGQIAAATARPSFFELAHVEGLEGPVRVLAVPVATGGRELVVAVGASLADRDEALDGLGSLLLAGGPIVLLLASVTGFAMAGAALRPVEAMRRQAAAISGDPDRRLPVPEADDELSRLGRTLNEMLARLEATLERERRFVDDASHELRTPLALHRIELELALRHSTDERELRAAIASASEEIDRLIELAERLLVVARAEDGKATAAELVRVEDSLAATSARFELHAEREGRVLVHDPADANLAIEAGRASLDQALSNMVDNAIRHGHGEVRIFARRNGDRLELHVTDEGPGVPDAFIEHAFERFSRADTARGRGGTGLGLSIVETIAHAHGGAAFIRNLPHGGLDVWIEMPFTTISSVGGGMHAHS